MSRFINAVKAFCVQLGCVDVQEQLERLEFVDREMQLKELERLRRWCLESFIFILL